MHGLDYGRVGVVLSQPSDKYKDVARMGRPAVILDKMQNRREEDLAIPGAQKRSTWGTQVRWCRSVARALAFREFVP
jgi:hypothetical protein